MCAIKYLHLHFTGPQNKTWVTMTFSMKYLFMGMRLALFMLEKQQLNCGYALFVFVYLSDWSFIRATTTTTTTKCALPRYVHGIWKGFIFNGQGIQFWIKERYHKWFLDVRNMNNWCDTCVWMSLYEVNDCVCVCLLYDN